mmetsp:Transcript_1733/g.188  ORF Transcript_1733/g.188 Transcript_1733/m.188 type:complete len:109 (+) Transcript_1733:828-1154(+)
MIIISGYMPATSGLYQQDGTLVQELSKHHRNFIKWNKYGDLFIIAGFGNLPGNIEIWSRQSLKLTGFCKREATVACEWSPCGRMFVCATISPRIRVDNSYSIYNYYGE